MPRDPAEGVTADGLIRTGAPADRVPAAYRPVVVDCTARLVEAFGGRLHGLYLYGSVATGQARPPGSDLDLLPVWASEVDAGEVAAVAATLESAEHGGWTTDRATGAALLAEHHPEWTDTARQALRWITEVGEPDEVDVRRLLDLGDWLATRPGPGRS